MFLPHLSGYARRRRGPNAAAWTSAIAALAMVLLGGAAPGRADSGRGFVSGAKMDTEHLFGFIEGSDIGAAGEKELEVDSTREGAPAPSTMRRRHSNSNTPHSATSASRPRPPLPTTTSPK
jgi:hypothetical protein